MKTTLLLACRNLKSNAKYTIGIFAIYIIVSVVCVFFFLFNAVTKNAYNDILNKRVSSYCVSVTFSYTGTSQKYDLSANEYDSIMNFDEVTQAVKYGYNTGAIAISLDNGKKIYKDDISLIATENGTLPDAYIAEFDYSGDSLFLCGSPIDKNSNQKQCLVSDAFLSITGCEVAEDLLGKKLSVFYQNIADETSALTDCVIVGVISQKLYDISAMEKYSQSQYFVFADYNDIENDFILGNSYSFYADYNNLDILKQKIQNLGIQNASISLDNNSYALSKLADMIDFICAILILIGILCIAVSTVFLTTSLLHRFEKTKVFYYASFSLGMSKLKMSAVFLTEYLLTVLPSFLIAIPICSALMQIINGTLGAIMSINFALTKECFYHIAYAFIPLLITGIFAVGFTVKKINYK